MIESERKKHQEREKKREKRVSIEREGKRARMRERERARARDSGPHFNPTPAPPLCSVFFPRPSFSPSNHTNSNQKIVGKRQFTRYLATENLVVQKEERPVQISLRHHTLTCTRAQSPPPCLWICVSHTNTYTHIHTYTHTHEYTTNLRASMCSD